MRLTVLGGGGFRVPLIYRALSTEPEWPEVDDLVLHDLRLLLTGGRGVLLGVVRGALGSALRSALRSVLGRSLRRVVGGALGRVVLALLDRSSGGALLLLGRGLVGAAAGIQDRADQVVLAHGAVALHAQLGGDLVEVGQRTVRQLLPVQNRHSGGLP